MWIYALIPFFLQAVVIGVDEGVFHYKRGLPKWECIGHPMDTLSLLICFLATVWMPFNESNVYIFIGLAVLSCLMVTKDEFIHKEHCPGAENWLHAVLFVLHPITLLIAGLIWPVIQGVEVPGWLSLWLDDAAALRYFMFFQIAATAAFMFYQLIFWNFVWKNHPVIKQ